MTRFHSALPAFLVTTALLSGCGGGRSDESEAGRDASTGAAAASSGSSAAAFGVAPRQVTSSLPGADVSVTWNSTRAASVAVVSPDGVESTSVLLSNDHGADVYSVGTVSPTGAFAVALPEPGAAARTFLSIRLKSGNTVELPL